MIKNKLIKFIKEIKSLQKYKTDKEMRKYISSICDSVSEHEFGPMTMNAQTAVDELIVFFLGKDWYVVDPLTHEQINPIIVIEIEEKFYYCKKDK